MSYWKRTLLRTSERFRKNVMLMYGVPYLLSLLREVSRWERQHAKH